MKRNPNNPRLYWIVGTLYATEDPVTLGNNGPSDKPLFCSLAHAQFVASKWASVADTEGDHPLYSEVTVVPFKHGEDPRWGEPIYFSRAERFAVFGIEATESPVARLADRLGIPLKE